VGVSITEAVGVMGNLSSFSFLIAVINLNFLKVLKKHNCGGFFYFFLSAIEVHPTMMTSAYEKPGNVKRVH